MQINLDPSENLTIKLGDRGVVVIQWINSEDCLVGISYEKQQVKATVDTEQFSFRDSLSSITIKLNEK